MSRSDTDASLKPAEALIAECRERASMYRLLARLYYKPLTQSQIEALADGTLRSFASVSAGSPIGDGANDMERYLRKRHTGTREELAADFTGAFYGISTRGGRTAMPYESLFRNDSGMLMGEARGEVYHEFKTALLRVREGIDLPEDHLSFIFEYLAVLCDRTADALAQSDRDVALQLLAHQRRVIESHVANWLPGFIDLASEILETRFYRGCLKVTSAFVHEDLAVLSELTDAA